jgi:response regulator RpfG family c-di-GMP phosphodiesterase
VVRIILTGYSHVSTLITAINKGQVYRYLIKPWKLEVEFIPTIRQGIEYHNMLKERRAMIKKLKDKNLESNRQNLKIQSQLKQIEKSDQHKTEIINHLTREVTPYICHVIKMTGDIIDGRGKKTPGEIINELEVINNKGELINDLLRRVENLLMGKEE